VVSNGPAEQAAGDTAHRQADDAEDHRQRLLAEYVDTEVQAHSCLRTAVLVHENADDDACDQTNRGADQCALTSATLAGIGRQPPHGLQRLERHL
jgi:hypothetical protein